MRDRQTCIGCGKKSPETETNYTLISAQFGWRLTRYRNNDGTIVIEWRCPACWREYKKAKGDAVPAPGMNGRSSEADIAAPPSEGQRARPPSSPPRPFARTPDPKRR